MHAEQLIAEYTSLRKHTVMHASSDMYQTTGEVAMLKSQLLTTEAKLSTLQKRAGLHAVCGLFDVLFYQSMSDFFLS